MIPRDLGSYVIMLGPVLTITVLLSIPFLSKGGERSPLKRPWAIGAVAFLIITICGLWYIGNVEPWHPNFDAKPLSEYTTVPEADPSVQKGIELFNTTGCLYCHKINGQGGNRGPNLTTVQNRLTRDQMIIRIVNGAENMPAYGGSLSREELDDIVDFLLKDKKNSSQNK